METNKAVKVLKPTIRPADTTDYPFLLQMLYEAIHIILINVDTRYILRVR